MTTKLHKETKDFRDQFRSKFKNKSVARITKENPNYSYKFVSYDDPDFPEENVDKHEARGYEFVVSSDKVEDDRTNSPDNDGKENARQKGIVKRTKDGISQVLMRIPKEREDQNSQADQKDRHERYLRSTNNRLKQKSTSKANVTYVLDEVNENNIGDAQDE